MEKLFRQVLAARTDLLIAFDHEDAVLERQIGAESNTAAACDWCSGSRTGFASQQGRKVLASNLTSQARFSDP